MLHAHDTVMDATLAGNSFQVFLCCFGVSIPQVLLDSIIEKDSILRHDNDMLPERFKSQILNILVIDEHLSINWVIDSEE